jgi:hypothetical protein
MTSRKFGQNTASKRVRTAVLAELPAPQEPQSTTQLCARIAEGTHRRLRLASVMTGMPVQILVEQAVLELLANHPELLANGLASQKPSKSASRTSR